MATVCGLTLIGVVGSMFWQGCAVDKQLGAAGSTSNLGEVVAKVGNVPVYSGVIDNAVNTALRSTQMQPDASAVMRFRGSTLVSFVRQAQVAYLAKQEGVSPSDDQVVAHYMKSLDPEMLKLRLMMGGQLKQNATQAEFDAAVKAATGRTFAELKAAQEKEIRDGLADDSQRDNIKGPVYQEMLLEKIKAGIKPSDDELKRTLEKREFKKVLITPKDMSGQPSMEQARKVLAEIKGGLSFESAITKYSGDVPDPGKKLSDKITSMAVQQLEDTPKYNPLLKLKVGEVSDIIDDAPAGLAIYKLVAIKSDVPKDFDKTKENLRKSYAESRAPKMLDDMIKSKAPAPTWSDKAYEVLYQYTQLATSTVGLEERQAKLKQMIEDIKAAAPTDKTDIAPTLAYNIFSDLYQISSDEQKKGLADLGIVVYNQYFSRNEDIDARIRLADFHIEKGQGAEAIAALEAAAKSNEILMTTEAQFRHNEITKRLKTLEEKKLATAEQMKRVEDPQLSWSKNKQEDDKRKAEEKRLEDEAKEKAKKDAEAAKKAADAASKQSKPTGGATTGATTAGATTSGATTAGAATAGTTGGARKPAGTTAGAGR